MTDSKAKKGWIATSMRKNQYNGLVYLATKDERPTAQFLYVFLRRAGVPELTDEELEVKLGTLRKKVVGEVLAR